MQEKMKENFMKLMGCIPPIIPVTDDDEDKKCPLYHLINDKDQVEYYTCYLEKKGLTIQFMPHDNGR